MSIEELRAKVLAANVENPMFADERARGATCFEIDALGGCVICWGKGKWLGITDGDWNRQGRLAPRTIMSCPYCRGTGLKPRAAIRAILGEQP